jgi:hypothetical protein
MPWEFQIWPTTVNSAWFIILMNKLEWLWTPSDWTIGMNIYYGETQISKIYLGDIEITSCFISDVSI